jgi:hypothetical protein
MVPSEFRAWHEFYKLAPFDDMHRYHRPAALIARSIGGGDIKPLLEWLAPTPESRKEAAMGGLSEEDMKTLAAFGFTPGK